MCFLFFVACFFPCLLRSALPTPLPVPFRFSVCFAVQALTELCARDDSLSIRASQLLQLMITLVESLLGQSRSLPFHERLDREMNKQSLSLDRVHAFASVGFMSRMNFEWKRDAQRLWWPPRLSSRFFLVPPPPFFFAFAFAGCDAHALIFPAGRGQGRLIHSFLLSPVLRRPTLMRGLDNMVDSSLMPTLRETVILNTKDHTRWKWDKIINLLEGPMRNANRISEALKTKFFKRQLSFLTPEKRIFSEMEFLTVLPSPFQC